MRFKSLSALKRRPPEEVVLAQLPQKVFMTSYARDKALKISQLVREIHGRSFEWYGFTLAEAAHPELIVDVGLPPNDQNRIEYTALAAQPIAAFQASLPPYRLINGWIHSHGVLKYAHFSETDRKNHLTVLDFVTSRAKRVLSKREVIIGDLSLLAENQYTPQRLQEGSVTLVTDRPVTTARLLESVYGGFSYAIVIGDSGWHVQEVHYKKTAVLSKETSVDFQEAELVVHDTPPLFADADARALEQTVRDAINPAARAENIERM